VQLQSGAFDASIPILFGSNKNEAITFIYGPVPDPVDMWVYEVAVDAVWPSAATGILAQYQNSTQTDGRVPFCEVLTDYLFACSQEQFGVQAAKFGGTAYAYKYNHVFSAGWLFPKFGLPAACANATCHAAELPFVFHNEVHQAGLNVSFTPAERVLSQSFVDYWTTFAHTGNPNTASQPVTWPKFDGTGRQTLFMDEVMSVQSTGEICEFWDTVGYNTIDSNGPRWLARYPPQQRQAIMQRIRQHHQGGP